VPPSFLILSTSAPWGMEPGVNSGDGTWIPRTRNVHNGPKQGIIPLESQTEATPPQMQSCARIGRWFPSIRALFFSQTRCRRCLEPGLNSGNRTFPAENAIRYTGYSASILGKGLSQQRPRLGTLGTRDQFWRQDFLTLRNSIHLSCAGYQSMEPDEWNPTHPPVAPAL